MSTAHGERKHSKFSASGSDRWFNCQGSVALSEGLPDKDSVWSLEGTKAHEVLERLLRSEIEPDGSLNITNQVPYFRTVPKDMLTHGGRAGQFIVDLWRSLPESEILVETRIHLGFIHPEMFGTFDGAVIDHFGTLHVFDYKYGAGHAVSPKENLQMIFYGLGLASKHDWNFKRVRLWIIQPRIKGYQGPLYWEIGIGRLKEYADEFKEAVERVEKFPDRFSEGQHCYWCRAKSICPLKQEGRLEKAVSVFKNTPIQRRE